MTEIDDLDALGLAELVKKRAVSPRELLDHSIRRAAQVNPTLNSVVTEMHAQAYAGIEAGLPAGPLSGVPFLLKDLRAQYGGVPTTHGSRMFRDDVAAHDSELVRRLKRAGLVIFGKTNTSEFGCCPSTEGGYFGTTRNPWDTSLSAGGSSGGSAAAVAARIVPAAHGSDGGGSIRIPAACCGVFGFKPSRGVNPAGPDYGEAWNGLSVEHALTRSVRDSAAILDVTRGPSSGDPYCGPTFERSMLDECSRPPRRLRIAVQRAALSGAPVDPECIAAVDAGVRLLESLGHIVEEAAPTYDYERVSAAFALAIAANVQGAIDQLGEKTGKTPDRAEIGNVIGVLAAMGHQKTAADMARAVWTLHRAGRAVGPFFDQYDALLSPVVATPPPKLGTLDTTSHDVQAYLAAVFRFIPFTALSNIAGIPSMALPIHWRADGVPIGIHFTAGYGRDGQLFSLAAQLESVSPWAHRKPALVSAQ